MNPGQYRWFSNFACYYLKTHLGGEKRPLLAGFKITHNCNLHCQHCPFWKESKPHLNFEQIKQLFKKLHDWGVRLLLMEGGEPFLWRDGQYKLQDLVSEAKKYFYTVTVTTNGTVSLDLDSNTLWVSLDGLEETHNYIRGKKIFSSVIQRMQDCKNPNLYVNTTISTLNWEEIPHLIRFLDGKVKGVTIQFYYPYEDKEDPLFLPFKQRAWVLDQLINLKKEGLPVANSFSALEALKENTWINRCHDWMVTSIEPDGTINQGCYLKNRGVVRCDICGFSTHTELSLAYDLNIESINIGRKIFRYCQ